MCADVMASLDGTLPVFDELGRIWEFKSGFGGAEYLVAWQSLWSGWQDWEDMRV